MVYFTSDYSTGAHPQVLKRLIETNEENCEGYCGDEYCAAAAEKIKAEVGDANAEVEFLVGGTQTNAIVLSALLKDHEGVVSADTGHIFLHESGAIENTGHKVISLPSKDGKISVLDLANYLENFYLDESRMHMVYPGAVYISYPTEYGTLYSLSELKGISKLCKQYKMRFFIDGARLGYGLVSEASDSTIRDIYECCDAFYIGGTKAGALFGEAVVFKRGQRPEHFKSSVKKRGALLAKGRLLGVQFDALFTSDLYYEICRGADQKAMRLKDVFAKNGYKFLVNSYTNQQFVILSVKEAERLKETVAFSVWQKVDNEHIAARFATGWATTDSDIDAVEEALKQCSEQY